MKKLLAIVAGASLFASACGTESDTQTPAPVVETNAAMHAALSGVILDWNDQPVGNAEVMLAVGGETVTTSVFTDTDGRYRLTDVPVDLVEAGLRERKEVSLLFFSPREDLAPHGTVEGDRIHLLPVTLREFIDMDDLAPGADVWLRTAYVPLQQRGYKITPELIKNGGELTWKVRNSPVGGDLEVTVIVEPGSIIPDGEDPQDEITLTILDAERAPMQIPNNGVGILWTLQPRDIRFDPPARLRIKGERLNILGLADADVGSAFEINGATLERGWKRYGDVEIADMTDMTVTLESTTGIIPKGAWGHVLSNPDSDAGALVTCRNALGTPVVCAIWDAFQVAETQKDYNNTNRPFYFTDRETICGNCTDIGAPYAQMATGLNTGGEPAVTARLVVTELCASWLPLTNEQRDLVLFDTFNGDFGLAEGIEDIDDQVQAWADYCNDPEACPFAFSGEASIQRARFSKNMNFTTNGAHCAPDDRQ